MSWFTERVGTWRDIFNLIVMILLFIPMAILWTIVWAICWLGQSFDELLDKLRKER